MADAHTVERLVEDLRRLGVAAGDVVMVHASLRAIGPVEGRAAGVVRALDATLGAGGTSLMMIGADDGDDRVPFDALVTPAQPDVGVLAEVFRTAPGTLVSDHPEGRFAARGGLAHAFTRDVPWHDYYGPASPLQRLVDHGGHVLRLGADRNTVTLIHYAEYLATVPDKRRVTRRRLVLGPDGPVMRDVHCLDDSDGIVAWEGEDYFATILDDFMAAPGNADAIARGYVGGASSERLDARALVTFAADWMTRRFGR